MKFDYIFLDYDGPVLDGMDKHYQCYHDIITEDGGDPLEKDIYWNMKRQKISRVTQLEHSNYPKDYNVFLNKWIERIETKKYLNYDILKPDISNQLSILKSKCHHLYLVTMRNNRDELINQLEKLKIYNVFDSVINCSSINNDSKYNHLKNTEFKSALIIGDTEEETKTADKMNIPCIAITNGIRDPQFLQAEYYAEDLKDINWEMIK